MSILKFIFTPALICDIELSNSNNFDGNPDEDFQCDHDFTTQNLQTIINWYREQMSITGEYNGIKILEVSRYSDIPNYNMSELELEVVENVHGNSNAEMLSVEFPRLLVTCELESVDDKLEPHEIEIEVGSAIDMLIDPDPSRNYDIEIENDVFYFSQSGFEIIDLKIAEHQDEQ